ncbi:MAG: UpxY family transcription antiterminator [Bryobacterales bacterium]|nr:UpxY family transcription antiterminator [Bryobacterales bacterium]
MENEDSRLAEPGGGLNGSAWYAIQVKTTWEKQAGQLLENKGYEIFVPLRKTKRKWSDRTKEMEVPLFPSYIFGRFDAKNRLPILTTPAVFGIVSAGKQLLPVPDEQVEAIQNLIKSGVSILSSPFLKIGQRVVVEGGALDGQKGILTRFKNSWRVVISVDLIQQAVAVEVDREQVRVIEKA